LTVVTAPQNKLKAPPSPLHLPLLRDLWLSGNKISSLEAWVGWQGPTCGANGDGVGASGGISGMWLPSLHSLFLQDNAVTSRGLPRG
jgi:hypothetical protein